MDSTEKIEIEDYVDVEKRAMALDCNVPTGLAILPRNFGTAAAKNALLHEDTAPTVRALLAERGITETRLERDAEHFQYIHENSYEWVGPTVLIGSAVFSQNPHVISITLSLIANYLTDFFKGRVGDRIAKLSVVVPEPNSRRFTKITYEGSIEGIPGLEKIIREVRRGRRRK